MRKNPTAAEKLLWDKLKEKKLDGFKFRNQHPVFRYIVDFYCREKKLAIEVDGQIHEKLLEADAFWDDYLRSIGVETLRITNGDIENGVDEVCERIREKLRELH